MSRKETTQNLKARGSWRAKTRPYEPKPKPCTPKCPTWLSPEAKKVWRSLVPDLAAMKILTATDKVMLAVLCDQVACYIEDTQPKKGNVMEGEPEFFPRDPRLSMKLLPGIIKLADRFGMSPVARTSLIVPDSAEDDNPKVKYFTKGLG